MAGAKSQKLEDQAAKSAMYDVKPNGGNKHKSSYPLDDDNKLSSAGAAASLKYIDPRDLPSFPSAGFSNKDSWAGAAASLANANQKAFEYWKPDPSVSANKAALLAKDYKAAPRWHPEMSSAGSKAALLAAKDGGHVDVWRPEPTNAGSSAAGQAMRMKGLSPQVYQGVTIDESKRALLAATGAMSGSRKRAGSMPIVNPRYPGSANAATNALSAATLANKPTNTIQAHTRASTPIDGAQIHNAAVTKLSREMYTSHPPVAPEIEEKNRQAGLRAAAISMAKQMYDVQEKAIEAASADVENAESRYAATSVHNRQVSTVMPAGAQPSVTQYTNLQGAAQKLAAERLAKLHDEHAAYRNYYGAAPPPQSRLSIRGRTRRRASSDGQIDDSDAARSKQIRSEMSLFNDKLAQVDAKKRQQDRDSLMAAAQRNVKASMHGMDEKVFNETGKASPAMIEEREAKASARAKADSEARMVNHGRVDIGGGKYLDQSEIDAIAVRRVQPTLDEITEKVQKHRARDEQLRQAQLERERLATEKFQDQKERDLRTKEEWKKFREDEKLEIKAKKEEKKAKKAEQKRLREGEKRRGKEIPTTLTSATRNSEERPVTATEPPILDPIPNVGPLSTEAPGIATAANKEISLVNLPLKLAPKGESVSARVTGFSSLPSGEISPVELAPITNSIPRGTTTPPIIDPDHAEHVAARVLSAPIVNEELPPITDISPSLMPVQTTAMPLSIPKSSSISTPEEPTELSITTASTALTKPIEHTDSVSSRTDPVATTQTTITGPAKEPKSESKVSSWLKSKFSSRTNKPTKEVAPESSSKEKAFVGGATLTDPNVASQNSLGPTKISSVREAAMAGRQPAAVLDGPVDDHELYAASEPRSQARRRDHPSSPYISSISSDEDTRGRSTMRREETESTQGEEFEEALDHFDKEALAPPATLGTIERVGGSPVRDSKFQEIL